MRPLVQGIFPISKASESLPAKQLHERNLELHPPPSDRETRDGAAPSRKRRGFLSAKCRCRLLSCSRRTRSRRGRFPRAGAQGRPARGDSAPHAGSLLTEPAAGEAGLATPAPRSAGKTEPAAQRPTRRSPESAARSAGWRGGRAASGRQCSSAHAQPPPRPPPATPGPGTHLPRPRRPRPRPRGAQPGPRRAAPSPRPPSTRR